MSFIYSELNFRRYEPFILRALQDFPVEVSFAPTGGRALITEVARTRDAIASWKANRWASEVPVTSVEVKLSQMTTYSYAGNVIISSSWLYRMLRKPWNQRVDALERFVNNARLVGKDSPIAHAGTNRHFMLDGKQVAAKEADSIFAQGNGFMGGYGTTQSTYETALNFMHNSIEPRDVMSPQQFNPEEKLTPTQEDISHLPMAEIVDKIENGEYVGQVVFDYSQELLNSLHECMKDKLNVAYFTKDGKLVVY